MWCRLWDFAKKKHFFYKYFGRILAKKRVNKRVKAYYRRKKYFKLRFLRFDKNYSNYYNKENRYFDKNYKKSFYGTNSYMPGLFGLYAAETAIRYLLNK